MSDAKKETVESLTAYYKQAYYEGEYSVGDLCVMLARAEMVYSALESDLARVTRALHELARQSMLDEARIARIARIERDRHHVQEVRELRAALTEAQARVKRLIEMCNHPRQNLDPTNGTLTCQACGHEEKDPFHHNPGGN